jgi:hypothetical protein
MVADESCLNALIERFYDLIAVNNDYYCFAVAVVDASSFDRRLAAE